LKQFLILNGIEVNGEWGFVKGKNSGGASVD